MGCGQGERSSPIRNRFQAGLSLPLYAWTYRSQIQAADARLRAATAQRAAVPPPATPWAR